MGMNAKDLSQRTYFESKPITKEEVNYPRTLTCRMRGVKDNAAMLSAGPREAWIEVVNNTTGAKTRLNVMAKMDDSFAIEISGPDDSITVDLDIEETRVGTAMLPVGDAEFVTLRKETADNGKVVGRRWRGGAGVVLAWWWSVGWSVGCWLAAWGCGVGWTGST